MQPDLLGLEFTKGELKRLTGVNPDHVSRASIWRNREKRFSYLSSEFITILIPTLIVVGLVYTFVIRTTIGTSIPVAIALFFISFIFIALGRWIWQQKKYPQALKNLLNNVDRYHTVIHDVDNLEDESQCSKIIPALQQLRTELVQALQIERQHRERQQKLTEDTFSSGFSQTIAVQTSPTPIVNTLLQISSSVQAEVRKLQSQFPK